LDIVKQRLGEVERLARLDRQEFKKALEEMHMVSDVGALYNTGTVGTPDVGALYNTGTVGTHGDSNFSGLDLNELDPGTDASKAKLGFGSGVGGRGLKGANAPNRVKEVNYRILNLES